METPIVSFKMSSLLVHNEQVPVAARNALRAAHEGARDRLALLESAARILHQEVGVPCMDARELVDLLPADMDH